MNYVEDMETDAKFPLDYSWHSVNNFVFNPDITFEDMQALCLGLASELERHPKESKYKMKTYFRNRFYLRGITWLGLLNTFFAWFANRVFVSPYQ